MRKGRKEKKSTGRELFENVSYLAVAILLAFLLNRGLGFLLSTDMPIVAVESNSMVPTFYKGDILIIRGVENYKIGDIIVFSPSKNSVPIVHRIIKINDDGTYQTAGDANDGRQLPFEKRIEKAQIHGKMIFRVPYLGWIKLITFDLISNHTLEVFSVVVVVIFIYGYLHRK